MAGDSRMASGGRHAVTVAMSDSEMADAFLESDSVSLSPDPTHPHHLALEIFVAAIADTQVVQQHVMPAPAGHSRNKLTPLRSMTLGAQTAYFVKTGTSRCVGPA